MIIMANILKKIMSYFRSDRSQKENDKPDQKNTLNQDQNKNQNKSLSGHIEKLKLKASKSGLFSKIQEQKIKDKGPNQNNQDL